MNNCKLIFKNKIFNKVFTHYEGIQSPNSTFIQLNDAYKKIKNLDKKLTMYLFNKLNIHNTGDNCIITFIPKIKENKILEIYIKFTNDFFDRTKLKKYIDGLLHVIGEEGIIIKDNNKKYLFII